MTSEDIKHQLIIICGCKATLHLCHRGQELCGSGGGRPGLPVPKGPYGLCGRKATLNELLPAMLSHLAAAVSACPLVVK